MTITILATILVLGAVLVSASAMDDVEAGSEPEIYYCYGNTVIGTYDNPDQTVAVKWRVTDGDGAPVSDGLITISEDGRKVSVDATDLDEVVIEQTVSRGTQTDTDKVVMIPLHMEADGTRTVTFVDRGQAVKVHTLTSKTVIRKGDEHIRPPEVSRTGYVFNGWYLDDGCTERFDPTQPVDDDMTVYAGWRESTGGNVTVVVVGKYLMVFNVGPGLEYNIVGKGSTWVSFAVAVQEGYVFADGSIFVDANGRRLVPVDGVYRIDCTEDTDVQLYGTRQYSVAYDLTNARTVVDGFDDPPRVFPDGGLRATIIADNGGKLSIRVYSNGADITAQSVNGDRVVLGSASGNILIVASAPDSLSEFPSWMYMVIISGLLVVIAALALRRCRCETDE